MKKPISLHVHTNAAPSHFPNKLRVWFNDDGSVSINDAKFTLDSFIKDCCGFSEFCRFVIPFRDGEVAENAIPYEVFSQTAIGKRTPREVIYNSDSCGAINVVFLPEAKSLRDARWRVMVVKDQDDNYSFETNVPVATHIERVGYGKGVGALNWIPSFAIMQLGDVVPDGKCEFRVSYLNPEGEHEQVDFIGRVKTNAGYLPRTKLEFKKGVCTVPFHALGLDVGDEVTLKFGIEDYSALGTITFKVKAPQ